MIGLVAGLVYGWWGNPTLPADTTLPQMRADYRTDYVLMTAEIFRADKDAILTAQENGYNSTDVTLLADLASAMLGWQTVPTVVNR
jgi:hypothetical protein